MKSWLVQRVYNTVDVQNSHVQILLPRTAWTFRSLPHFTSSRTDTRSPRRRSTTSFEDISTGEILNLQKCSNKSLQTKCMVLAVPRRAWSQIYRLIDLLIKIGHDEVRSVIRKASCFKSDFLMYTMIIIWRSTTYVNVKYTTSRDKIGIHFDDERIKRKLCVAYWVHVATRWLRVSHFMLIPFRLMKLGNPYALPRETAISPDI
jgi:hypothetical protein